MHLALQDILEELNIKPLKKARLDEFLIEQNFLFIYVLHMVQKLKI